MIKYFLVPMTDPPYSKSNPQRPKYLDNLKVTWSGIPLFESKNYIIKVSGDASQLGLIQENPGVIDFPNVETDRLSSMPIARRNKNSSIFKAIGINETSVFNNLTTLSFISLCANKEIMHGWNPKEVYVGE